VSGPDERREEEAMLERLRGELLGEEREPPSEGIAAVRMQAERRRAELLAREGARAPAPRRKRRDVLLGGVAASVGAAAGVAGYAIADDDPAAVPTEAIALEGAPRGVDATAALINHTWGVELLLTVSGLQAGATYDVVYRAAEGEDLRAGSFIGVAGSQLCRMTGALLRDQVRAIEVLDADGAAVLRSRLSA
jgi:hypothetical protein